MRKNLFNTGFSAGFSENFSFLFTYSFFQLGTLIFSKDLDSFHSVALGFGNGI
jgi:hypothetical protein